jgi:hypothetical protein
LADQPRLRAWRTNSFRHGGGLQTWKLRKIRLSVDQMVDADRFKIAAIQRVIVFATNELPATVSMMDHEPDRPLGPEDVATHNGEEVVHRRPQF